MNTSSRIPAALVAVQLGCVPTAALAQAYIFTNNAGRQIVLTGKESDPEAFIIEQIRKEGGSGWGLTAQVEPKQCVVWQGFEWKGKKQYFREFHVHGDWKVREQAKIRARAKATAANPEGNAGTFGGICAEPSGKVRKIDLPGLEMKAKSK